MLFPAVQWRSGARVPWHNNNNNNNIPSCDAYVGRLAVKRWGNAIKINSRPVCTQRLWSSRWECARYSKRTAAETLPRTVFRCRVRARTRERRRARSRPTRPAVHYPPSGRVRCRCVRWRPRVCAWAFGHVHAAAVTPTGRQCPGVGDSACRPIAGRQSRWPSSTGGVSVLAHRPTLPRHADGGRARYRPSPCRDDETRGGDETDELILL